MKTNIRSSTADYCSSNLKVLMKKIDLGVMFQNIVFCIFPTLICIARFFSVLNSNNGLMFFSLLQCHCQSFCQQRGIKAYFWRRGAASSICATTCFVYYTTWWILGFGGGDTWKLPLYFHDHITNKLCRKFHCPSMGCSWVGV